MPSPLQTRSDKFRVGLILGFTLALLGGGSGLLFLASQANIKKESTTTPSPAHTLSSPDVKKYGNKYAAGLLPVGDSKFSTTGAKKGYIYACNTTNGGGAQARGPWFADNNTKWDLTKKTSVQGSVAWTNSLSNTTTNGQRVITSNGLPGHKTGTFPVASTDPAYTYDRNPNRITGQTINYTLPANPTVGPPQCVTGQVGIMLTGALLFNGFDAGMRDAGAWEIQDGCDGHPERTGVYHYHTLSRCITDQSATTVIGFALDGFPITGPKVGEGNIMTTDDLDECHGTTSEISLDGKKATMYHYVMTQDFPYSVSCFKGTPIKAGQASGQQTTQLPPPPRR